MSLIQYKAFISCLRFVCSAFQMCFQTFDITALVKKKTLRRTTHQDYTTFINDCKIIKAWERHSWLCCKINSSFNRLITGAHLCIRCGQMNIKYQEPHTVSNLARLHFISLCNECTYQTWFFYQMQTVMLKWRHFRKTVTTGP